MPHPRRSTAILTIVLLSYFMILLDNSVIFTALPALAADMDLGPDGLAWVQDAYTLVFGGLLLLGARAGDILGRRQVFVFGLAVFSVASLLIAAAPSAWWIISARGLQGVGAAVVAPSALSLLTASFEGRERDRAVAWYAATAGIGASLGMLVGGAAATFISWRAGFWINVPIGAAMMLLAPRFLPETARVPGRFDATGAVTSTLGIGALVFGLLRGAEFGWDDPFTVAAFGIAVVLLISFVFAEARATQPILPLHLFGSRIRTGAYLVRLTYLGAMIGFFFFTTQFLQGVLGFTALQAGLAFLPMTLVNFVVALAIPAMTARFGGRVPLVVGILLTGVGMLWLSRLGPDTAYATGVALPMLLIGAGQGLAFAPMTTFGVSGITAAEGGAASGAVNTFHQIGMSLGLGVLVAVATASDPGDVSAVVALTAEVSAALTAASGFLGAALVLTFVLILPAEGQRGSVRASLVPTRTRRLES